MMSVAIQRRELKIRKPIPWSAAIISAATTVANELPIARRMPVAKRRGMPAGTYRAEALAQIPLGRIQQPEGGAEVH